MSMSKRKLLEKELERCRKWIAHYERERKDLREVHREAVEALDQVNKLNEALVHELVKGAGGVVTVDVSAFNESVKAAFEGKLNGVDVEVEPTVWVFRFKGGESDGV